MIRHRTAHCDVRISTEGLRRAAADNDLHRTTAKRNERLHGVVCWVAAICLGLLLAYTAAQTAGMVS